MDNGRHFEKRKGNGSDGMMTEKCDVLILGAGAAGMMCAIRAGQRGRSV
ncbi:MAG: FAD-binding protein, partial [Rhizobium oryzihabitans]